MLSMGKVGVSGPRMRFVRCMGWALEEYQERVR